MIMPPMRGEAKGVRPLPIVTLGPSPRVTVDNRRRTSCGLQAPTRRDTKDTKGREGHRGEAADRFVSLASFVVLVFPLYRFPRA
jgi:hypothetical protein